MKKIAVLAPNETKLIELKALFADSQNEIAFAVGSLSEGLLKAKQLIECGVEIIIARGETAFNIRDAYPGIAVIDVPISGFDLALALEKARQYGENVAVVSFPSMIKQVECLETAIGVKIKKYYLTSRGQVNAEIDQAVKDGADVLLGGFTTISAARQRNLPCVEIFTGMQAYMEAVSSAKSLLVTMEQEKRKTGMIRAVLDSSYEGIVSVDEKGRIVAVNPVAKKILKASVGIGADIDDVWSELKLKDIIKSGVAEHNHLFTINGVQVLCNKVPIKYRSGAIGAVATFQDVTKIQMMESRIRKEIYSKGHIARYTFDDIYGTDPVIKTSIDMAKCFAASNSNVLITGETGTGKEVFAQSIHNYSKQSQGPFVAVNCAALPAQLLESELFGYVRGAFTGASKEGKAGLFEVAHTGTIFLDEIGEMDFVNQGRLLRVLQERAVLRLGSDKIIPISVRVIAATNKNLNALVSQGKFREDLFYRLNVLHLRIPPLKKRKRAISLYAKKFLEEMCRDTGAKLKFSSGALKLLENQPWTGNVRQLKNVVERVAAVSKNETVSSALLTQLLMFENDIDDETLTSSEEAKTILQALQSCNGVMADAAEMLKMNRTTLWRKMNKLGINKYK
ncbi:sigma 54-interacting transcriptional regulator [Acetonema longum]|uniref:Sigma-54 dependent transcription regulator n=1 Tax=Acetonema longum DSM 6540 TaxID=1009370 RepID=F7NGL4_9FIRM|nr:sigma 54-interacting transcriptional regulator [Acetonema longum]EGO64818.1 sigma-54 dependent transcription regulator [Acetonema longum DSM 6540]